MSESSRVRKLLRSAVLLLGAAAIFIIISQLSEKYGEELKYLVGMGGIWGAPFYVLLVIFAIVIPPIGVGFLLPVAANVWGPFHAALLSILGWTLGAQISFWLARRFGKTLVKKVVSLEKIEALEKYAHSKHIFWSVVLWRMALPVDFLSYALGLFSRMGHGEYFLATLIGVIPFGILFSYAAVISFKYQIIITLFSSIAFALGAYSMTRGKDFNGTILK